MKTTLTPLAPALDLRPPRPLGAALTRAVATAAERRLRRRTRLSLDHLSDRLLRDIGIHERGPRGPYRPPHIWL